MYNIYIYIYIYTDSCYAAPLEEKDPKRDPNLENYTGLCAQAPRNHAGRRVVGLLVSAGQHPAQVQTWVRSRACSYYGVLGLGFKVQGLGLWGLKGLIRVCRGFFLGGVHKVIRLCPPNK